jgi:hypothetical protein
MHRSSIRSWLLAAALLLGSAVAISQDTAALFAPVQGSATNGDVLTEDSCDVLATTKGKRAELREVPGMHVLDRTVGDPLVLTSTVEVKISAVVCWRSQARLAPNDYLVPHQTGVSLYIKTDTGKEAIDRTIALEKVSGSFRVRLLEGPAWSPAEEAEMERAIQLFVEQAAKAL